MEVNAAAIMYRVGHLGQMPPLPAELPADAVALLQACWRLYVAPPPRTPSCLALTYSRFLRDSSKPQERPTARELAAMPFLACR